MKLKLKRFLFLILINTILIGFGVFILELTFGNWIRPDNLNRLNIIRDRKITYNIKNLYESSSTISIYTRDRYGFRGIFKDPSQIDILTIGGSSTDQRYITDGQTWQDIIEQKFKSADKNIFIANAGIDGQSTFGHIKNFDWWFTNVPNLEPKYILFYVGLNDFYIDEGYGYDALITDEKEKSIRQVLKEKSAIYLALRTLYGIYQAEVKQGIGHRKVKFSDFEWTETPLHISWDKLMHKRLKEYAERLAILISKTKEFGSQPIFVTQPSRKYRFKNKIIEGIKNEFQYYGVSINGVDYYHMMRNLDKITMSICNRHNVICFDMANEKIWEDNDFYDFAHLTPKGAMKIGEYLFEKLKDKL